MNQPLIPPSILSNPLLGAWVTIRADGKFEVRSGKVELGQGISAALLKIACSNLGVEPEQVQLVAGDTQTCPDEGYTSGSQSIEVGGVALAFACARMRQLFAGEASQRLDIPVEHLSVTKGVFSNPGKPAGLSYQDIAPKLNYLEVRLDRAIAAPELKTPAFACDDEAFVRFDLQKKLAGAGFVHDLTLPGMLHARVLRGAHPLSRPVRVNVDQLRSLPGVERVVYRGDFLALLGSDESSLVQAQERARQMLKWETPELPACADTETVLTGLSADAKLIMREGQALGNGQRLRRRYSRPYIAHAAIGPSCALAAPPQQDAPELTVWSHTQGAYKLRDQIAQALRLPSSQVRVIHTAGAGCYGHNGADDAAFDAAYLAHLLKLPIRVQWSREDELSVAPMGAASLVELEAGLDAQGNISDWKAQVWSHSHLNRPGWGVGVNLLGAWSCEPPSSPPAQADVPLPTGGGLRNTIPGYELPALEIQHHFIAQAPVRVSALRSLGAHANVFAIESFMDELALLAKTDPVEFRLRHLRDERARQVVQTAARMANWPSRRSGGDGRGLGIGFARYKNRAGYCAVAMEVQVEEAVKVRRVWAAVDAGAIVHRDGLLNQIEGGIIQALSWSLKESVTWNAQGVTSSTWDSYPILNFDEVPEVQIELIDQPTQPSLGSGEVAAGPVAAALGNAVAHALGLRARHLPLTPERLLQLIDADSENAPEDRSPA
jgi:nicotinate dehydrogenase subunit B